MNEFQQLCDMADQQIQHFLKKLSPKTIMFCYLIMEDHQFEKIKKHVPINSLKPINDLHLELKETNNYSREQVIEEIKVAYQTFQKEFQPYRMQVLFQEKKGRY